MPATEQVRQDGSHSINEVGSTLTRFRRSLTVPVAIRTDRQTSGWVEGIA